MGSHCSAPEDSRLFSGPLVSQLTTNLSLMKQSWFMRFEACKDPSCELYLSTWWPDMGKCLLGDFNDWAFASMTCQYFGGCGRTSQAWTCQDVSKLIGNMLAESPSVVFGAEQHLHGPCFCQSANHTSDPACQETVTGIIGDVLPAMSRWIQNQTNLLCGDDSASQGTCARCQEEAGDVPDIVSNQ